jgi:hypothetical protein
MALAESLKLLEQYRVVILPALVVAEQVGIPLPGGAATGRLGSDGRTPTIRTASAGRGVF